MSSVVLFYSFSCYPQIVYFLLIHCEKHSINICYKYLDSLETKVSITKLSIKETSSQKICLLLLCDINIIQTEPRIISHKITELPNNPSQKRNSRVIRGPTIVVDKGV